MSSSLDLSVISAVRYSVFSLERGISMNIIVCIKQVPGSNKVEVDPATGVLKRDGVESKMNPYDL